MKPRIALGLTGAAAVLALGACSSAHSQDDGAKSAPSTVSSDERVVYTDGTYPDGRACQTPHYQDCGFYSACLESAHPCGSDGYALGYGEKYCHRFMHQSKLSERGMAWRDATMACLQRQLVPFVTAAHTTNCSDVTDSAFASHAACYTQPGHSICALPVADIWTIMRTLDGSDALSLRSATQIRTVLSTCLD